MVVRQGRQLEVNEGRHKLEDAERQWSDEIFVSLQCVNCVDARDLQIVLTNYSG